MNLKWILVGCLAIALSGCTEAQEATATVVVSFGSQPDSMWDHAEFERKVTFTPGETPTKDQYVDVAHIGNTSVHDLLEIWSHSFGSYNGTVSSFGFFLEDINGVAGYHNDAGTPGNFSDDYGAYWQVFVGNVPAEEGASAISVEDGMVVKFAFTKYGVEPA